MSKEKNEELQVLHEISKKLDNLIKINAMSVLANKTMTEQVGLLSELNFSNSVIAKIVGTSADSVKSMKSQYKKTKK